jgi:broad specificity phosphatase PhoE
MFRRPKGPTRIWIARHGQTETNRQGIFCGHAETALTPLGQAQARALAVRLRAVPITAVYTSDFARAMDTAALALEGRALAPRVDPDLRELHYGEWELRQEREIARLFPEQYGLMRAEDPAWCPPGGETVAAVRERTLAALRRIARRHRGEQVLVVSHGTAINCMLSGVLGMAVSHVFRFDVANCGLSAVVLRRQNFVVTMLNDTSHLAGVAAEDPPAHQAPSAAS